MKLNKRLWSQQTPFTMHLSAPNIVLTMNIDKIIKNKKNGKNVFFFFAIATDVKLFILTPTCCRRWGCLIKSMFASGSQHDMSTAASWRTTPGHQTGNCWSLKSNRSSAAGARHWLSLEPAPPRLPPCCDSAFIHYTKPAVTSLHVRQTSPQAITNKRLTERPT